jgi:hypothetical protein
MVLIKTMATILDIKNFYIEFQKSNVFLKVVDKSKVNWNLNNNCTEFKLLKLEIESTDYSISNLGNKINNLLFEIDIENNDIDELKNLCAANNIAYEDLFYEIDFYREYYYDYEREILVFDKPVNGYVLNENNEWVPPTPKPKEGSVGIGSTGVYVWSGESLSWEIVYPPSLES